MKKVILFSILFVASINITVAQYVNHVHLKKLPAQYISAEIHNIFGRAKYYVNIDYGQLNPTFEKNRLLKNENGKKMIFNSEMDALNYLFLNGYEYMNSYVMKKGDFPSVFFILKKMKKLE